MSEQCAEWVSLIGGAAVQCTNAATWPDGLCDMCHAYREHTQDRDYAPPRDPPGQDQLDERDNPRERP